MHRSPDEGAGAGGSEVKFTPEQDTVVQQKIDAALESHKPEMTLKSATDYLKNANIKVFSSEGDYHQDITTTLASITGSRIENPNALEKSVLKFKSGVAGEILTPIDQELKNLTGKDKQEGEKTRDYIKRILPEVMKGGEIDAAEFNSTKTKLSKSQELVVELQGKFTNLQNEIVVNDVSALISKGMPTNLDYSASELNIMLPGIRAQIKEKYEIKKDDKGFMVIDRQTEEAVLNGDGHRKSVDVVVNDFVKSLTDLRFKKDGSGGANLPGDTDGAGESQQTEEQLKDANKKWVDALAEKGLIGHEKEAFVMRKAMSLPITKEAIEKWPELK